MNPRRAPAPIELGGGAKLVMTSGGYRTVSSRATVARFRKHVSPLTGVVTRLERIEADLPMNTNFYAQHNFSAPAQNVDELRAGLSGGSFGKGSTAEQAEASALMEAIERYSGIFQGDEIRVTRRFTDFAPGDAILPNDVLLFSDAQSPGRSGTIGRCRADGPCRVRSIGQDRVVAGLVAARRALQISSDQPAVFFLQRPRSPSRPIPTAAPPATRSKKPSSRVSSNWWSAMPMRSGGTTGRGSAEVDLSQFDDSYVRDLQAQLADTGRKLWVLDVTSDLGVPTYVAILHWMQNGQENIEFGSGAHFDKRIALLRTLTELNQFMSIGMMGGGTGEKPSLDGTTPLHLQEYPFLTPSGKPTIPMGSSSEPLDNTRDQVLACVEIARRAGLDFLVLDQTRPDVEVPVVRVIVPGLRHFYRRFGAGPALRCSGEARIARSAAAGKRTHAIPSP